jgi:hypothetical protein
MFNTTKTEYTVFEIDKLINQFISSPINSLQRASKNNKNMQNEPNSPNVQYDTIPFSTSSYKIFFEIFRPKNKAKQSQFMPKVNKLNFNPKLALKNEPPRPVPQVRLSRAKIFAFAKDLMFFEI